MLETVNVPIMRVRSRLEAFETAPARDVQRAHQHVASLIEAMKVVSVVTEVAVQEAPSTSVLPQSHVQQRSALDERIIERGPGFHRDVRWVG